MWAANALLNELQGCLAAAGDARTPAHPAIVPLLGVAADAATGAVTGLVMERVWGCSLGDVLEHMVDQRMDRQCMAHRLRLLSVAARIASALDHMHSRKLCVHGDIKLDNVLVATKGRGSSKIMTGTPSTPGIAAYLSDFGLSTPLPGPNATKHVRTNYGTPRYTAPEIEMHGELSFASDVYAFGRLLFFMGLGGNATMALAEALVEAGLDEELGFELCDLSEQCSHDLPDRRPNMAHLARVLGAAWEAAVAAGLCPPEEEEGQEREGDGEKVSSS